VPVSPLQEDRGVGRRHNFHLPHHFFEGRAGLDDLCTMVLPVDAIVDNACGLSEHRGSLPTGLVHVARPHGQHGVHMVSWLQRGEPSLSPRTDGSAAWTALSQTSSRTVCPKANRAALRARAHVSASPWAVMKRIGSGHWAVVNCCCSSRPLMPGIRTSTIRQAVSGR